MAGRVTNWSIRYDGWIQAPTTGEVQLWTRADDGVRLRFEGKPVINDWTIHAPLWKKAVVQMVAGKRYPIRLDYFQAAGGAVLQLQWSWAGSAQTFIPRSSLWHKTR